MEVLRRKRKQTVVLDEVGLILNPLEDFMFYGGGKGGAGGVQYIPMQQEPTQYTPPPVPPPKEEATMELAEETDEDMAMKKQAVKLGAKSLRIPIGSQNLS